MSRSRFVMFASAFLLLAPAILHACLWDYDTLQMERSRFPSALELITGKFLRHSPEFYAWRIEDRKRRLESEPENLALYDDLAVAYDKIGQHDKAIETILIKDRKKPNQYETLSNLGTFYIFVDDWDKSVETIDRALAINPNAHFGREKYQKYLVQYVLTRRKDGKFTLPLGHPPSAASEGANNFYEFLLKQEPPAKDKSYDVQPALKGVMGMMRFANHDSPLLLEALGDLLLMGQGYNSNDAKRLAARAYLKASYEVTNETAEAAYRQRAKEALALQRQGPNSEVPVRLEEVETSFKQELVDADSWYADLHKKEKGWIAAGTNPETEFDRLYKQEPTVASPEDQAASGRVGASFFGLSIFGLVLLVVTGLAVMGLGGIGLLFLVRHVTAH